MLCPEHRTMTAPCQIASDPASPMSSPGAEHDPSVLRGVAAIATFLNVDPWFVKAYHRGRMIPTFVVNDEMCSTSAALDSWCYLVAVGEIPVP